MSSPLYVPNLKTSDSELRALRYLSSYVRDSILPAFELTRSRITSKHPQGSAGRRAEQLLEAAGGSKFILDLTTEADLLNEEMEGFFDEKGGYVCWRSFVSTTFSGELIPSLLYVDGGSERNFKMQVEEFLKSHDAVAIRSSISDREDARQLYAWALDVASPQQIFLIGSLYFLEQGLLEVYLDRCASFMREVVGNRAPKLISFPGSSFPKAVGSGEYGADDRGAFPALELPLYNQLIKSFPNAPIVYSDYASVHPIRYPTRGGSWVPRIDIFNEGEFVFSRLRAGDGGYEAAANTINASYGRDLPNCWGSEQIKLAAKGSVPGRSPSFWISARINMWITKRVDDLILS